MIRVDFHVLEVGQGSMNFVEVFKDDTFVTTFLLDSGSGATATEFPGSATGPSVSVQYVVGRLYELDEPSISALVLSHSDADHTNRLPEILAHFNGPRTAMPDADLKTLTIDGVFFSGDRSKYVVKGTGNVMDLLHPYLNDDPNLGFDEKTFGCNVSCVNGTDPTKWEVCWPATYEVAGKKKVRPTRESVGKSVRLLMLAANTTAGNHSGPYKRRRGATNVNMLSLVTVVQLLTPAGPIHFIAMGDATADTMAKCNVRFDEYFGADSGSGSGSGSGDGNDDTPRMTTFHVTAPHHGSDRTTYGLAAVLRWLFSGSGGQEWGTVFGKRRKLGKRNQAALDNIAAFVRNIGAQTLSASAGQGKESEGSEHLHPSGNVLADFNSAALENSPVTGPDLKPLRHFFVAHYFSPAFTRSAQSEEPDWPPPGEEGWATLQTTVAIYTTQYILPSSPELGIRNTQHYVVGRANQLTEDRAGKAKKSNLQKRPLEEPLGTNFTFRAWSDATRETLFVPHAAIAEAVALGLPMPEPVTASELSSIQRGGVPVVEPRPPVTAPRPPLHPPREIG